MPSDYWSSFPLERPHARQAGMPRRFGIGVLMILTALFAVLSSVLAMLGVPPGVFAVVGVLFVGVAVAQAVLYGGTKPRRASVFAGSVLLPVEMAVVSVYRTGNLQAVALVLTDPCGLLCAAIGGAMAGYVAGFMTAFTFLIMNRWAGRGGRAVRPVVLQPFAESDIDKLLCWVDSPELLWRWSKIPSKELFDRELFLRHLESAAGPEPTLMPFKVVSPDSGRMIGYVELRDVDREQQSANVALALIAPNEPDRGGLSVGLLLAVQELAFAQMQLQRLRASVLAYETEPRDIFKALGFASEEIKSSETASQKVRQDMWIMTRSRQDWLEGRRTRYGRVPPEIQESDAFDADG